MSDYINNENEVHQMNDEDPNILENDDDDNLKCFKELLMQENINILAKLKKYKALDFRRKLVINEIKELKKLSQLSKIWVSVPYNDQSFNYPVISVDSSKAGSNTDALRLAINDLGWRECPNGRPQKSCHVVWNSCNFNDNKSNTGSYVNKFPGISQCLHKVGFTRILETMRTLFPEHYSFYPQTWYLPHQMVEFVIYCKTKESENNKERYYIVKPDAGTQGEGIYLIKKPQDYRASSKNHVVQEYLDDPLLLDGYKFDLRIYVVLLSLDPLKVYICNEGLARLCTHKYFHPTTTNHSNTFMHLTNYSLNKKSNQFIHTQNLDTGSKRTMSSVFAALNSNGYDVGNIWKKLEELVYKTILAIVPQLKVHYVTEIQGKTDDINMKNETPYVESRPSCFQILGFDVLIMDDLQPLLLEVNSNPSLRLDCEMEIAPGICEYYLSKVDIGIKRPLVKDTLKLLEKDISEKFNIDMRRQKDPDWIQRVNDILPVAQDNSLLKSPSDISEKENFDNLVTEWNIDSEFGPYFTEIAKQNNTLPHGFGLSRSNSPNENTDSKNPESDSNTHVHVTVVDTSSLIRREQIDRKLERLAKEKSWLNVPENDENESKDANGGLRPKSAKSNSGTEAEEDFCLNLISSKLYKSIYDKLRILEETTVIFFYAMGCRYTGNMGATSFRTFGRRCNLHKLGFNHAMIDLIYIEVQRRWAFLTNYESKQGLCYQAFLEAFFRIAFTKFSDMSKRDAVRSLIAHCKRNIGPENFKWTRTLFPTKESSLPEKHDIRKDVRSITVRNESLLSTKSLSSEHSETVNRNFTKPQKSSTQSKYDIMKAIHQIYRRELRIPKSSKFREISNSDTDSVKSLPSVNSSSVKHKQSGRIKQLSDSRQSNVTQSDLKDGRFRIYRYESPSRPSDRREGMMGGLSQSYESESKKSNSLSMAFSQNATTRLEKSSEKKETFHGVAVIKDLRNSKNHMKRLPVVNIRNGTKEVLPVNNERMMKIISAYGGQGLLKSSFSDIRRKFGVLKPI